MIWSVRFPVRGVAGITLAQSAALLLPMAVIFVQAPERVAIQLVTVLLVALFWEALFAVIRQHGIRFHGVTTALIFAIVIPPEVAVWQAIIVMSLGVILGELVFGGRGFGFVQPATVALALLLISFPQIQFPEPTQPLALATLPGAVLLLALGFVSWRVLVATAIAFAISVFATGGDIEPIALATALLFGVVFLICDPVAAASTNPGRWIYGLVAGGLIAVFSSGDVSTSGALVLAALMTSVFAPLIDHLVIVIHAHRRARRHA